MAHLTNSNFFNIVAALLIASMLLMNFNIQRLPQSVSPSRVSQAVIVKTPCQQSKNTQSLARSLCQAQTGLQTILTNFLLFFTSLSGKLYFIFVSGLFAVQYLRRIEKPPRLRA